MRRPKKDAHPHAKMICEGADQKEMRMRSSKKGAHAQAKNEMRMGRSK